MITKTFKNVDDSVQYIVKKTPIKFFIKQYIGEQYTMVFVQYNDIGNVLVEGIAINVEGSSGGMVEITHE